MSETRSQQEPSMEEILASIRRIISEDGQEPQGEEKPESPEKSEPRLAQPAQSERKPAQRSANEEAERPRLRAVGSGEAEILVLTEMVAEDGSVVSLAAQSPTATDLSTTPESAGLPEPPDSPSDTLRGEAPEESPRELPGGLPGELPGSPPEDPPAGSFGDPDLTQRRTPPALDERGPARPEAVQPEAAQPEATQPERDQKPLAETVEEPKAEKPKVETVAPQAETTPAFETTAFGAPVFEAPVFESNDRTESEAMSNEARKKLELVSQEAEAASTAALAELARTVTRDKDSPIDGGRSVEDLVLQALKPMLREWLDANLPDLVERVVRTEIQRMVRRAEDKA